MVDGVVGGSLAGVWLCSGCTLPPLRCASPLRDEDEGSGVARDGGTTPEGVREEGVCVKGVDRANVEPVMLEGVW